MKIDIQNITFPEWENLGNGRTEIVINGCVLVIDKSNEYIWARITPRNRWRFKCNKEEYLSACAYLQRRRIAVIEELAGGKAE